ncbi:MAG TPA: hypothetical protein VGC32_02300 [Solirubrobacterales bacterium]
MATTALREHRLPGTAALDRLVAQVADGAAERERAAEAPFAAIDLVRETHLAMLRIPAEDGGGGATPRQLLVAAPNVHGAFLQLFLQAVTVGALRAVRNDAVALVNRRRRSFSHSAAENPADDPQILQVVGEIAADAFAAEAIVLAAAERIDAANASIADGVPDPDLAEAAQVATAEAKVAIDAFAPAPRPASSTSAAPAPPSPPPTLIATGATSARSRPTTPPSTRPPPSATSSSTAPRRPATASSRRGAVQAAGAAGSGSPAPRMRSRPARFAA